MAWTRNSRLSVILGRIVASLTFAAILAVPAFAQAADTEGWTLQSPRSSVTPADLNAVFMLDGHTGWAGGSGGTIVKTVDGGAHWFEQSSNTHLMLYRPHFVNANTGWVVGESGIVLKTTNGGDTWTGQPSSPYQRLISVCFIDENTGWVAGEGGTIRKTTDGGATWVTQASGTTEGLSDIQFIDANTGWAFGNWGTLLKTTNGGTTWARMVTNAPTHSFWDGHFISADVGWAAGTEGTILKTVNGGLTWALQPSGTTKHLSGFSTVDGITAWAGGSDGTLLKTTDGGATWTPQASGTTKMISSLASRDDVNAWLVGAAGTIRATVDGTTWKTQNTAAVTDNMSCVRMLDATTGWAVGANGRILKTVDSGDTWEPQDSGVTANLYRPFFIDASTGWVVGSDGVILKTTNGGASWTKLPRTTWSTLVGVHFANADVGWAAGTGGVILKTTNGGTSWTSQTSGTDLGLSDIQFVDTNTGWAFGNYGTLLKTTDGGASWNPQVTNSPGNSFWDGYFLDANVGWAAGTEGTILKTVDGGATWERQTSGTTEHLSGIHSIDGTDVWAVGWNGTMLKSVDGGVTWALQAKETPSNLTHVYFVGPGTGWVTGYGGVILGCYIGDHTAPVTTRSTVATTWVASDVTLTLSATDEGDGVDATYYRVNSGYARLYSSPIQFTAEGLTNITYWSVDNARNTETAHSVDIRVDKSGPTKVHPLSYSSMTTTEVILSWPASADAYSGVSHYEVFDGETSLGITGSRSFAVNGLVPGSSHIFSVCAVDKAGNVSLPANLAIATPDHIDTAVIPETPDSVTTTLGVEVTGYGNSVDQGTVTVTLTGVTVAGSLSVVRSEQPPAGAPATFKFVDDYFDVSFTGEFEGTVTVTLPYDARMPDSRALNLKVQHWVNNQWESVTPDVVDTVNKTLTFSVNSLSPLVFVEPNDASTLATIGATSANGFVVYPAYGAPAQFAVTLKTASSTAEPLSGFALDLKRLQLGTTQVVKTAVSNGMGSYVATITPLEGVREVFKLSLAENSLYSAQEVTLTVVPHAKLTTPKRSVTTTSRYRTFYVSGDVNPNRSVYARVQIFRYSQGKWRLYSTKGVRTSSSGYYKLPVKLGKTGTYKCRAVVGANVPTSSLAESYSSFASKVYIR